MEYERSSKSTPHRDESKTPSTENSEQVVKPAPIGVMLSRDDIVRYQQQRGNRATQALLQQKSIANQAHLKRRIQRDDITDVVQPAPATKPHISWFLKHYRQGRLVDRGRFSDDVRVDAKVGDEIRVIARPSRRYLRQNPYLGFLTMTSAKGLKFYIHRSGYIFSTKIIIDDGGLERSVDIVGHNASINAKMNSAQHGAKVTITTPDQKVPHKSENFTNSWNPYEKNVLEKALTRKEKIARILARTRQGTNKYRRLQRELYRVTAVVAAYKKRNLQAETAYRNYNNILSATLAEWKAVTATQELVLANELGNFKQAFDEFQRILGKARHDKRQMKELMLGVLFAGLGGAAGGLVGGALKGPLENFFTKQNTAMIGLVTDLAKDPVKYTTRWGLAKVTKTTNNQNSDTPPSGLDGKVFTSIADIQGIDDPITFLSNARKEIARANLSVRAFEARARQEIRKMYKRYGPAYFIGRDVILKKQLDTLKKSLASPFSNPTYRATLMSKIRTKDQFVEKFWKTWIERYAYEVSIFSMRGVHVAHIKDNLRDWGKLYKKLVQKYGENTVAGWIKGPYAEAVKKAKKLQKQLDSRPYFSSGRR